MEGPLSVWTNPITGWHLCWVVLDERMGMLFRFKSHSQRRRRLGFLARFNGVNMLASPPDAPPEQGAIVTKDPRDKCGFSVISEGREYRFQAPSRQERDTWVLGLEEAVLRQMVGRRAYHIWDRRYIGPTLALVNAKLQDADLLYEELAYKIRELDTSWNADDYGQRVRWSVLLRNLLVFLTTARAAITLLKQLKVTVCCIHRGDASRAMLRRTGSLPPQEMLLPDLVAQLNTLPPRKKAATMLSLLKSQ
ncbi:unnamed protein product, partial [Ixodes hexagonus]